MLAEEKLTNPSHSSSCAHLGTGSLRSICGPLPFGVTVRSAQELGVVNVWLSTELGLKKGAILEVKLQWGNQSQFERESLHAGG